MNAKIARIAAVGAAAALVLPASQAFAASKTENALIGAAIGALAGGLLSNGDTGAVVAGAAVGGAIGVATDKPDRRDYRYGRSYRTYQTYPANRYYGRPGYRVDDHRYEYRRTGYDNYGRYGYRGY